MKWASAASTDQTAQLAVDACAKSLRHELGAADPDLVFIFLSSEHRARFETIPGLLRAHFPNASLIGCSAQGIVGGGKEMEHTCAMSLVAASLPGVKISPFRTDTMGLPDEDAAPEAWHKHLAIPTSETLQYFIVLADPFSTNIDGFTTGMDYAYPGSTVIGGLASAARRPGQNVLYLNSDIFDRGLVGVCLEGNIAVDTIVAQGCRPIGKPAKITSCHGTLLNSIDGKPALQFLQELAVTLPTSDRQLMQTSLFVGFQMNPLATEINHGHFLIRNLTGIDPENGSIAVGEHMSPGQIIQFHLRDKAASAEDLANHLQAFKAAHHQHDYRGALLFTCLGRGQYLYGVPNHDTDLFNARVGAIPLGGFFCNGEIGPVSGTTYTHGYTSSFGLFRARE